MATPSQPPALRLPRARRLIRARDFERVYREGSRARGSLMTVAVAPNGGLPTRLGLSIGKRVWKGAVQRNRVRRVFREAFRLEQHALPPGVDLIVIGTTPRVEPALADARRELLHLAHKAWRRHQEKTGPEGART